MSSSPEKELCSIFSFQYFQQGIEHQIHIIVNVNASTDVQDHSSVARCEKKFKQLELSYIAKHELCSAIGTAVIQTQLKKKHVTLAIVVFVHTKQLNKVGGLPTLLMQPIARSVLVSKKAPALGGLVLLGCFLDNLFLQDQASVPREFSDRSSLRTCLQIWLIIIFCAGSILGSPVWQQFFPLSNNFFHKL